MTRILASRVFSSADQQDFARLSSDFNPMHLDQDFAADAGRGAGRARHPQSGLGRECGARRIPIQGCQHQRAVPAAALPR
jgi:hypothetical protein